MLETTIPWLIGGQERNDGLRENEGISFDRSQSFPCNTEERSRPTVRSFPYERGGSEANRDGDERRERESECERGGEGLREGEGGAEVERGIGRAGGREGGRETDRISPFPCLPPSSHPPSFTALVVSSKYFYVPTISYTLPLYTLYIYLSGIYAYLYACTSGPAIHRSERHIKST